MGKDDKYKQFLEKTYYSREVQESGYEFDETPSFEFSPFSAVEIQYIRGLIIDDKLMNGYQEKGMELKIDQDTSMHEFTERLLSKLDKLENNELL